MKAIPFLALALFSFAAVAASSSRVPEACYDTVDGGRFCTTDHVGSVQVFVYNAGWCPPCNQEMSELPELYKQLEGKGVVFASLSGEGWQRGARPDATFLAEWRDRHNIPFVVAGKFKDFGKPFDAPNAIPFSVIVDKEGNVVQKGNMSAGEIESVVKGLVE